MKPRPTARLSFPLASAIAALLAVHSASATNLYWDTNTNVTAGSGAATGTWDNSILLWNTNSSGSGGAIAATTTTNADDLFFAAGTNGTTGTVTVNGTQAAHSLTFEEGAITLTGGAINLGSATAGSGMSFANVAGYNINSAIILNSAATEIAFANRGNQTVTFGATGTITGSAITGIQNITIGGTTGGTTFSGIISDGGAGGKVGVTVNGAGTYTLGAANTYTGATNILSGTLQINNASTFTNTSAIYLSSTTRLNVNAANSSLAELATAGGGSGVVAGSFLRYSQAQTAAGASNGPGTIFGTVELNLTNVNPNYVLDFGSGGALTNLVASTYTSALTLSGTASIDASAGVATYNTGGITASTAGTKTLNLTGSNTGANTISSAIGDGSGTIGVTKGGGGSWVLSGTNTNTGSTRIDGGILQFVNTASLYNSTSGSWTAANIRVGNGGTLALNVGGTNQFTTGNVSTLLTNLGGANGTSTTGFAAGSAIGFDTTNASGSTFTVADVLANSSGTGGGAIGLTKLGTNTLVLSNDNTYTGRTVISGGVLALGAGGTTGKLSTSSSILNNGTLTINRSDAVAQGTDFSSAPIVGTGAFIQNNATGTTTLNAANTFSGSTTVTAGTLALTNALALQNSALNTTGAGFVTLSSATPTFGGLSNSGTTRNLATVISSGYTGVVTNLTLNTVGAGSFTYGGIIGEGATGMTLTKTGTGTQILSGANAYTGDTIVNGGTLTVGSGANGSLNSSSTLKMGGGSTFNYARTGTGQTVNGLTINAGNSIVNNTSGQTLTLAAITRTGSAFGTVNFGATTLGNISTTFTNVDSIIGPWATTGSTTTLKYAVGSAAGAPTNITALTGTTATAADLSNLVAGGNFEYSAATTTVGDLSANTLRYSGGNSTTAIGATRTLTLNGLMNAGSASTLLISGGPTTGGIIIGSTNELVIAANAQNTTISAVIKDGGAAGRLVYSGGGTLTLSGANLYSGGTVINSGTVALGASVTGAIGTGPITINNTGTLTLSSTSLNRAVTLNGGTLNVNSGNETVSGTIALTANSTIQFGQSNFSTGVINSAISGAGGLTKTSAGVLRFTNASNTYTGPTVISAGGIAVTQSLYGNDTTQWTPANITVAANAVLGMHVGGTGEFTMAQAATMFTNLTTNVNNNGLLPGAIPTIYTRNAPAGTYTYSAVLADSTGPGGGSVNFKFFGTATTSLELTGSNTYSGVTLIENNGTLRVSSFNSVFTNPTLGTVHSASSSLGAPTTVANGTIWLGNGGWNGNNSLDTTYQGANLTYTGSGETTDRVLNIAGANGSNFTLDQSGTGLLKFTSAMTFTEGRGAKTIFLQGSTAGTGELAGTVPIIDFTNPTKVTKQGTGTWTLSGTNTYAGITTINGGTLLIKGANNLLGTVAISTGGNFSLADGTARATSGVATGVGLTLATGSTMAFDWNAGSLDSFTTGGTATSSGSVGIIINNTSPSGSGGTLITALTASGSTLNTANYFLANNTNFTASLSKTATTVSIGAQTSAAALTNAYWKRNQVTGALDTMAYSLGTLSNWASDAAGTNAGGVVPNGSGVNVIFGTTGSVPGSPTLGADMNLGSITFNDTAAVTLAGSNAITLNSTSSTAASTTAALAAVTAGSAISVTSFANATNTISAKIVLGVNQTWNVASGKTLAVSDVVSGNKSLTKADAGTVTFSGANIFTGATIVTGGTLKAGVASVSGFSGAFGNNSAITLVDTAGVVMDITGFNTQIGSLTGGGTTGGNVTLGAAALTVGGDNTSPAAYAGIISSTGAGALTKIGAGTQILSGANSYTGATNVNAGKLLINGSTSTSSAVTVASGATLGGSGTVGGAVTIQAGGTFSPGNSIESIATGNLALLASATFAQEIDKSAATGVSGDLTATTGTLSITSGGTLTLAELGLSGAWTAGDKITLIGYSTGTWNGGLFTYLGNALNDDTNFTFSGIDWTFNYNDTTFGDNYQSDLSAFTGSARYVTMTAVPEPRAALLGGLGILMLMRRRRNA